MKYKQMAFDTPIHKLVEVPVDQNIDCGYSLEPPRRGGSNEYPQSMFSDSDCVKIVI